MSATFPCYDQQMKSEVHGCLMECFHTHRQRVLQRRARRQTGSIQAPFPLTNSQSMNGGRRYEEQVQNDIEEDHELNDLQQCICNCYAHCAPAQPIIQEQSYQTGAQQWNAVTPNISVPETRVVYINCDHQVPMPPNIITTEISPEVFYPRPLPTISPPTNTPMPCPEPPQYFPPAPPPPPECFYQELPPQYFPPPPPPECFYQELPPSISSSSFIPDCVPTVYQQPSVILPPKIVRIPCPEQEKYIPLPPPAPIPDYVSTVYQPPPVIESPPFVPMPCPEPPQYFPPPPPPECFYQELPPPISSSSFIPDCVPTVYQQPSVILPPKIVRIPCPEQEKYIPLSPPAPIPDYVPTVYQPPPVIESPPFVPMPCPEPPQYIPSPPPPPPECFYQEIPPQPIPAPSLPSLPVPPVQETVAHHERFCARCCCVPGSSLVKQVVYRHAQDTGGQQEEASADFSSIIDQLETKITIRYGDEIMTQDGTCVSGNYNEQLRVIDFPVQVSDEIPYDMESLATTY